MSERFDLADIPWQAWKNGAGRTREIAVEPAGAGAGGFDWRISVAEVAGDAPFSAFPGIDRCIVLLDGPGLRLQSDEGGIEHRLDQPLQPFRFRGELPLHARVLGGPSLDFNVMTRRGRWRSRVEVASAATTVDPTDVLLVYIAAARWQVDGEGLKPGQGRLVRLPSEPVRLSPEGGEPGARALAVRLWREAGR
ncbi:MAG: HutD family protein [Piscinibacter sp.]|nr:HutD family protein [Piscinibacter sp.]